MLHCRILRKADHHRWENDGYPNQTRLGGVPVHKYLIHELGLGVKALEFSQSVRCRSEEPTLNQRRRNLLHIFAAFYLNDVVLAVNECECAVFIPHPNVPGVHPTVILEYRVSGADKKWLGSA